VKHPKSILVVVDRNGDVGALMRKALVLAHPFGARLELFLCDSEQAYVLGHAYDRAGVHAARAASVVEARHYLSGLRELAGAAGLEITIDAQCESPLYESIVRKVLRSGPDLVMKDLRLEGLRKHAVPDPNDWQLMRTCPATLMLSGRRAWRDPPRFVAAIDVSEAESVDLSRGVIEAAEVLAQGFSAELHAVYGHNGSAEDSRAHLEKLQGLCAASDLAARHIHVLHGQPERTLPRFLREHAYDAVVLGALAHRSAATTEVGTLTSTLLDTLDCDFILVKSSEYRSPIQHADT
jgi:universal stress protein E